jgi:hypothetical protein
MIYKILWFRIGRGAKSRRDAETRQIICLWQKSPAREAVILA